jgi:hypothetical protein
MLCISVEFTRETSAIVYVYLQKIQLAYSDFVAIRRRRREYKEFEPLAQASEWNADIG